MTREQPGKTNNLGLYIDNYEPVKAEETVYGRDVAVDGFLKALLLHGRPGNYSFYQTHGLFSEHINHRSGLLDLAVQRTGVKAGFNNIGTLKKAGASFGFDNWHEADGDFTQALALRERFSPKVYPISATFHVLSYQYLLNNWFLEILLKKTYTYDTIICTSRAAEKAFRNILEQVSEVLQQEHGLKLRFGGSTRVIPLGVDTDHFKPRDKQALRQTLELPPDAFILLWIGRISPLDKADLLPLLLVTRELVKDNPGREIKLVLGGTGEAVFNTIIDQCIRDLELEDHVITIRPLPASRAHLYHAAADVFVSPVDNVQETFGITPLEAMACGLPQVVSDWDGYRDTIEHGKTGFLIPTYMARLDRTIALGSGLYDNFNLLDHFELAQTVAIDLPAFKNALQTLLDSPSLCAEMGRRSRKRALELYDWKNIVRLHENLWDEQQQQARGQSIIHPANSYNVPAFYRNFKHYASQNITASTKIKLTETGQRTALQESELFFYYGNFIELSVPLLKRILVHMLTIKILTFGEIAIKAGAGDHSFESTGKHILWLLKYGYLQVGEQVA